MGFLPRGDFPLVGNFSMSWGKFHSVGTVTVNFFSTDISVLCDFMSVFATNWCMFVVTLCKRHGYFVHKSKAMYKL